MLRPQRFSARLPGMEANLSAATDVVRAIRQNHAVEHATITLLLERGATPPLGGTATPWGFNVYGRFATEDIMAAADEALERMRGGESELAISPYCGTNLVVGGLLAALLSGLVMSRTKSTAGRVTLGMAAALAAGAIGRPLGKIVQRRYTTLSEVDGVEIAGVRRLTPGEWCVHHVRTVRHGA